MRLAFVDVETTGLDKPITSNGWPVYRVVEVALTVANVTRDGVVIEHQLDFKQRFDRTKDAWTPKALEINGYDDRPGAPWADAPLRETPAAIAQWAKLVALTNRLPLCSQNVPFDRAFLAGEVGRLNMRAGWGRRFVDLMSFSALIAVEHEMEDFGLHKVYAAMQGPPLPEHSAPADVTRGLHVFLEHHRRYFGVPALGVTPTPTPG